MFPQVLHLDAKRNRPPAARSHVHPGVRFIPDFTLFYANETRCYQFSASTNIRSANIPPIRETTASRSTATRAGLPLACRDSLYSRTLLAIFNPCLKADSGENAARVRKKQGKCASESIPRETQVWCANDDPRPCPREGRMTRLTLSNGAMALVAQMLLTGLAASIPQRNASGATLPSRAKAEPISFRLNGAAAKQGYIVPWHDAGTCAGRVHSLLTAPLLIFPSENLHESTERPPSRLCLQSRQSTRSGHLCLLDTVVYQ